MIALIVIFLAGLCFGSFMNVLIRRLPEGRSIVAPRSSCPECGEHIRWYDNIPVVSYLFLAGRCRSCGNRISAMYPLVEVGFAVVLTLIVLVYGYTPEALVMGCFGFFLAAAGVTDLLTARSEKFDTGVIPDALTLPGLAIGIVVSGVFGIGFKDAVLGAAVGFAILFIPAWAYEKLSGQAGLGGGDVKMLAMVGAYTGPAALPFIVLASSLGGLMVGIPAVLVTGNRYLKLPFGPFIALGGFVWIFGGMRVIPHIIRFIS